MEESPTLPRRIGLTLITLYGIGGIVGAGIYALIGELISASGGLAPVAFLIAAVTAAFTGLSYAELSSYFPKNAGEAYYAKQAFNSGPTSLGIGLGVVCSSSAAAASLVVAFAGYATVLLPLPDQVLAIGFILTLTLVALTGTVLSFRLIAIITLIEVGALLFLIVVGVFKLPLLSSATLDLVFTMEDRTGPAVAFALSSGALIAFFAFIGFEDIVNVAEEVKRPERNIPLAIILSLVIATGLYVLVTLIALWALPEELLATSKSPLADVMKQLLGWGELPLVIIAMIAITNGALIQIVLGSRLLAGLARMGLLPSPFAKTNPVNGTPITGVLLTASFILLLALSLPLGTLAKITSLVTLAVFTSVNLILLKLKKGATSLGLCPDGSAFRNPLVIPVLGFLSSFFLIAAEIFRLLFH